MHSLQTKTVAFVLSISPIALLGILGFLFLSSSPPSRPSPLWLAVAPTSQLPTNGQPIFLRVGMPRYDAWTRVSDDIVGNVYARRDPDTHEITVVSAVHGPLSVPVDYDQMNGCFTSRCYGTRFHLNGTVIQGRNGESSKDGLQEIDFTIVNNVLFVRNPQS